MTIFDNTLLLSDVNLFKNNVATARISGNKNPGNQYLAPGLTQIHIKSWWFIDFLKGNPAHLRCPEMIRHLMFG